MGEPGGAGGPPPGLCGHCRHARTVRTRSGSRFFLCGLSRSDPRYPRYPPLPVVACAGYAPAAPEGGSTLEEGHEQREP